MKALLLLVSVLILSASCNAHGDCCQGVEFCCDDCNYGSCTSCSVKGQCKTETQQRELIIAKQAFLRFTRNHAKKYATKEEEAKSFGFFFGNIRGKNVTEQVMQLPDADQRKLDLGKCYAGCTGSSQCSGACSFCYLQCRGRNGPGCCRFPN